MPAKRIRGGACGALVNGVQAAARGAPVAAIRGILMVYYSKGTTVWKR